jgi:NDP-sugar pyrophosphorylase family protein
MKVLIPMAGEGSRFVREGYRLPKPLIDVDGKPMIQRVVENLNFNAEYIFLVRKEHIMAYSELAEVISGLKAKSDIVIVDKLTEGAACTALLAKHLINDDDDLLIANSDQIISYSSHNFESFKRLTNVDSMVYVFNADHPKWSFVKVGTDGLVTEVAEKRPISNIATCGIYWYRHGSDFVKYAEKMIEKDIRVNNEFYIAPVYNEMIADQKTLLPFYVNEMHGIGIPDDLNAYLLHKAKSL